MPKRTMIITKNSNKDALYCRFCDCHGKNNIFIAKQYGIYICPCCFKELKEEIKEAKICLSK